MDREGIAQVEKLLAGRSPELAALYQSAIDLANYHDLPDLLHAIIERAVALIGATNLAVSFGLALWTAMRSRQRRMSDLRPLPGMLLRRLLARPRDFVWPPAEVMTNETKTAPP